MVVTRGGLRTGNLKEKKNPGEEKGFEEKRRPSKKMKTVDSQAAETVLPNVVEGSSSVPETVVPPVVVTSGGPNEDEEEASEDEESSENGEEGEPNREGEVATAKETPPLVENDSAASSSSGSEYETEESEEAEGGREAVGTATISTPTPTSGSNISKGKEIANESTGESTESESESETESEFEQRFEALKPRRLYLPTSSYQKHVKLGTRCYLKDVFKTLDSLNPPLTNAEREWFVSHPQFKHLFHMPKDHNHKVQGMWMLLLRTAEIQKRKEVWFVVNGVPVRYGLREHALISGLNCGNYPLGYKERGNLDFIKRHFGKGTVRQEDVKAKLVAMGAGNDRLKMAVLFFLSSIVCGQTKTGDGAPDVLEVFKKAVNDLDYCRTFPWGRFSYDFMLKEIMHTVEHFQAKGEVKEGVQWAIPGFCLPLELLAFEAIPQLGKRFREIVPGADLMCPRMCKSKFKKGDMKGFPIEAINQELGKTQDIDSLILISQKEEKDLLAQIFEEDDDRDEDDVVVDGWIKRLQKGYTVFFQDMFDQDVAARALEEEQLEAPPEETPPTELAEILKGIKDIQEKVNRFDARLAAVEAYVEEEKAAVEALRMEEEKARNG